MQIVIPAKNAQTLRNEGGQFVFGEGAYQGKIDATEVRELPGTDQKPFSGYTSNKGERVSLQIGNIVPLEEQDSPGNQKLFIDLVFSMLDADGKREWTLENYSEAPKEAWQLDKSAKMIANLANALGGTTEVDGNIVVSETFLDALKNGEYTGMDIGFVLYHRPNAKDSKKPYVEVETFLPVA